MIQSKDQHNERQSDIKSMQQQTCHQNKQGPSWEGLFVKIARLMFVAALSFLLLGFSTVRNPAQLAAQKPQPKQNRTLVCVVSRGDSSEESQRNMDAVVLVENGKLKQPYPEYNEAAQRKFASQYFGQGKKYRVTFGGGEVGSATVKGSDMGCNNIHATALVEDNGKIPAHLSALATDSDSLGRKPSARRAPTDAERQAAMKLVTQIYRSRGTTPALLHTLKTTNLTATDLDGDGKFELIGSFVIETKTKARRDLLLIAEPQGESYKAALVNFQAYKLPPEGFDSAVDFVDQLDLDGDGIAEVFVQQHGFDAYGYSIYKKSGGRWRQVYTATGDAC
jgi:hypothetical protein